MLLLIKTKNVMEVKNVVKISNNVPYSAEIYSSFVWLREPMIKITIEQFNDHFKIVDL